MERGNMNERLQPERGELKGQFTFWEKNGDLCYEYYEQENIPTIAHAHSFRIYEVKGIIPANIRARSKEEIRQYVQRHVAKKVNEERIKNQKIDKYLRHTNFPDRNSTPLTSSPQIT